VSQRPPTTATPVTPANRFDSPSSSSRPSLRPQLAPNTDLQYIVKYNQNLAIKKVQLEDECECDSISISKIRDQERYIDSNQRIQDCDVEFSEDIKSSRCFIQKTMNHF
jgi:hypothetical protein